MKLNQVIIRNFKGIEECTLDLKPGFNLLIGDNGYGKTSVLEAISVGLGGILAGLPDIPAKNFTKEEIRIVLESTGEGSFNKRYITPVEVECEAVIENETFRWIRRKSSVKASRSTVEPRDICRKAEKNGSPERQYFTCAQLSEHGENVDAEKGIVRQCICRTILQDCGLRQLPHRSFQ